MASRSNGTRNRLASVEVVSDLTRLDQHLDAWRGLAENAAEPNPFYEPFALRPAFRLAHGEGVRVLLVWAESGGTRQLVGLLPVVRRPLSSWLPMEAWMPWQHKYCFLTTPLIHRDVADRASEAILDWLKRNGKVAVLSCVGDGAVHQLLNRKSASLSLALSEADRRQRAFFDAAATADDYLAQSISGRHRKGYRRLERHLQAEGELTYEIAGHDRPLETWIEEFLRLEASGWKGRAGTAFADRQADRELFIETMTRAHAEGRLMGLGLYLNGRPVALKANLTCEGGAFAFKICYDEAFARFSPGVLLELENIRELHRRGIEWMDSCADEDHPMISRLWPGRREIRMLYLARPWMSRGLAALCRAKRAAGRRLHAREKQAAAPGRTSERIRREAHTLAGD